MKVTLVSTSMWSMFNFRNNVINEINYKNEVTLIAPFDSYEKKLTSSVDCIDWKLDPRSVSIFKELRAIVHLYLIIPRNTNLVVAYSLKSILYLALLQKLILPSSCKKVFFFPGIGNRFKSKKILYKFVRFLIRNILYSGKVITLNNSDYFFLREFFKNKKKVDVLLMKGEGFDLKSTKGSLPIKPSKKYDFCFASRLIKDKGIEDFVYCLEALDLDKKMPSAVICGDFDQNDEQFKARIKEKIGKIRNVEFVGFVDNPLKYINESKYLVLPSVYPEGVPRVLMEASALGVPALVYENVGSNIVICNNVNGWSISPNVKELLLKMKKSLSLNENEYNKMSKNAKKISSKFSMEEVVKFYYRHILN